MYIRMSAKLGTAQRQARMYASLPSSPPEKPRLAAMGDVVAKDDGHEYPRDDDVSQSEHGELLLALGWSEEGEVGGVTMGQTSQEAEIHNIKLCIGMCHKGPKDCGEGACKAASADHIITKDTSAPGIPTPKWSPILTPSPPQTHTHPAPPTILKESREEEFDGRIKILGHRDHYWGEEHPEDVVEEETFEGLGGEFDCDHDGLMSVGISAAGRWEGGGAVPAWPSTCELFTTGSGEETIV